MNILNLLKIAWRALTLNKVRAVLTMLGVIIGVACVITMLAIGEGSKESIKNQISGMGANMITIRPSGGQRGGVRMDRSSLTTLTVDDFNFIKAQAQLISDISPLVTSSGQAINGSYNWPTSLNGVTPEYLDIKKMSLAQGSMFSEKDVNTYAKLAVIGNTVAENLFSNGENPIGKTIRFNKTPFKIIGILNKKGESTFGQDPDDVILVPYTTVQKRILRITHLQSIVASAINEDKAKEAVTEVTELVRKSHQLADYAENDFEVFSMDELISTFSSTSEMLTVLLVAIASISLLIGGVGIMNIMYVSVKERTREIGLRLAIGAKEKDILLQFLIESILISVSGGLIGIGLGFISAFVVQAVLNWPTQITIASVVLSFGVCVVTGVFFGWYPARKAAALNPIIALRYE